VLRKCNHNINPFYTSLRKGDNHLKHNSLTSTIRWLTPTRAVSPSHTPLWPPCGSLRSTTCFCTMAHPYPVTLRPLGSGLFSSLIFSRINTPTFSNLTILHIYPPMKMEQTECSEMPAYKIRTPGNYPEESIQQYEIHLFPTTPLRTSGPAQPPTQWVPVFCTKLR
jgi:hypothetical protein